jgi:hypothetical protein
MTVRSSQALYALEEEFSGHCDHSTATKHTLDAIAIAVCSYYGTDVPNIRFINSRRNTHAAWYDGEIVLNRAREGANGMSLLHELAHFLVDEFYTDVEHHGPEFVAIYMHLLDRWKYLPNGCFRMLAKKHRLKIGRRYRPKAFNRTSFR